MRVVSQLRERTHLVDRVEHTGLASPIGTDEHCDRIECEFGLIVDLWFSSVMFVIDIGPLLDCSRLCRHLLTHHPLYGLESRWVSRPLIQGSTASPRFFAITENSSPSLGQMPSPVITQRTCPWARSTPRSLAVAFSAS